MIILLILALLFVVLLFGLSSISQSYASAKQAEAVIETARAAQLASAGNLVSLVTAALVVIAILAATVLVTWLLLRARTAPNQHRVPGTSWDELPHQPQTNAMLPALLTLLAYQLMQEQQHQQTEQFWMLSQPEQQDVPTLPDSSWDL